MILNPLFFFILLVFLIKKLLERKKNSLLFIILHCVLCQVVSVSCQTTPTDGARRKQTTEKSTCTELRIISAADLNRKRKLSTSALTPQQSTPVLTPYDNTGLVCSQTLLLLYFIKFILFLKEKIENIICIKTTNSKELNGWESDWQMFCRQCGIRQSFFDFMVYNPADVTEKLRQ